jgi:hypothetical protein
VERLEESPAGAALGASRPGCPGVDGAGGRADGVSDLRFADAVLGFQLRDQLSQVLRALIRHTERMHVGFYFPQVKVEAWRNLRTL